MSKLLSPVFWRKLASDVQDDYRDWIFIKAKDIDGKSFKGYSKKYGERKRAGEFKRQANQYKSTKAPILTTDLMRDYDLKGVKSHSFQIGWTSFAERVVGLAKMGRVLSRKNKPLPDPIKKMVDLRVGRDIKKYLGPNKTTRFKIG